VKAKLLGIGALLLFFAVMAGDFTLLHVPFVRNSPVTYGAMLVPLGLVFVSLKMSRTILTWTAVMLVGVLSAGYVAVRVFGMAMPEGEAVATVGRPAADFELKDSGGQTRTLASLRGDGGGQVVLVFYRGSW
jgi:hypothetical protein